MAIEKLIDGRVRDLGGFSVRRVLPAGSQQMVGPFIFFDHIGPADLPPGDGIDVRPHPHIALATVTYLFSGALLHRDSVGSTQEIRPGDVNWMTAGRGIVHSERTPAAERTAGMRIHGIQSWVALPDSHEDDPPAFMHHPASTLPQIEINGVKLTVIAGEAFGHRSPVAALSPTLYVDALLPPNASLELTTEHDQRAVYVVDGAVRVADKPVKPTQMAVFTSGERVALHAVAASRVMLLGGARFTTPRHIWWNFVSSSPERIEQAKADWRANRFPPVPGETEFIPLPER